MLIGLISDPHANIPALEAVLEELDSVRPDALVCLGDFVGYGANPNEVIAALRHRCDVSLIGNHDLAALEKVGIELFNDAAAQSSLWTRQTLTLQSLSYLEELSPRGSYRDLELAHGSFVDPVWEYITGSQVAAWSFAEAGFLTGAVGHTHVPSVFWQTEAGIRAAHVTPKSGTTEEVELAPGRVILNPGAVGQPRDGDPRASWATWESERRVFAVRRVEYPVTQAQRAIREAGLPGVLADRLAEGW